MRGARARALLLVLVLVVVGGARADEPLEDEVESAPFAVVVEHEDGWRCGGALVSLRAALSTASCARGRTPAPPADLWARAPGAFTSEGARRVARIAVPIESEGTVEYANWGEGAWLGAALDVALLELEAPFGAAARARPILMAAGGECAAARSCLAVRTPAHAAAPLRVGNATLAPPNVCADAAPHWSAVAKTVICLTGPQFCPSDWGVGVVCAGKLCGVLSRSASASVEAVGAGAGAGAAAPGCGTTHAAQDVPSWRAFVHCAQLRRHCGRDNCASVCSERMLLEQPEAGRSTREPPPPRPPPRLYSPVEDDDTIAKVTPYSTPLTQNEMKTDMEGEERRAGAAPGAPTRTSSAAPPSPPPAKDAASTAGRMAHFEFEPYRADFKSGEYGDNGASYEEREETPTRTPAPPTPAPGSTNVPEALVSPRAPLSAPPASAPVAERRAIPADSDARNSTAHVHRNTLTPYFCIFLFGINNR